jgi:hypothetical protein
VAKARRKAATAGADAPAVAVPNERLYRFTRKHTHADTEYAAGDSITLTEAKAAQIRQFAGADVLIDDEG